jgi:hypothetical protein
MKNDINKNEQCVQTVVIRWLSLDEELPLCYIIGEWDGKQSDLFLAETMNGKRFTGQCYEGFIDGNYFFDWYQVDEINHNDWLINETVSRWMKIQF